MLQVLQDNVEIWNPIWTLISGRDCAGEIKKLEGEGFYCSGNTNNGSERKYMLWLKSNRCRQAKYQSLPVLPDFS